MAEQPNDASRKSKAEGDRWSPESENAGADNGSGYETTDEQSAGITTRPLDEELSNQHSLPPRGDSKPGAHAGHGDDSGEGRSER